MIIIFTKKDIQMKDKNSNVHIANIRIDSEKHSENWRTRIADDVV